MFFPLFVPFFMLPFLPPRRFPFLPEVLGPGASPRLSKNALCEFRAPQYQIITQVPFSLFLSPGKFR